MAAELGIDETYAAAHMARLWCWALDNAQEGDLSKLPAVVIAKGAGWRSDPGQFVEAAVNAGWLDRDGDNLTIHDWWDYAGKLIEKRRVDAERKRQIRTSTKRPQDVQRMSNGCPMPVAGNRTLPYLTMEEQEGGAPGGANSPNESPPESTENERAMLHELKQVPGYSLDYEKDLALIRELATDFPTVDLLAEAKKWRTYKVDKPLTKKSNPRLQLRNWCEIAVKKNGQAPRAPTGKPISDQRRKEIELIKELYHT